MLRLIICPECGTEYKKKDIYFCFNCGARLPREEKDQQISEDSNKDVDRERKLTSPQKAVKRRKINNYNFGLLILTLIFFSCVGLFIYMYNLHLELQKLSSTVLNTEPRNKIITEATPSAIPRNTFGTDQENWLNYYATVVPKNVDSFLLTTHDNNIYIPELKADVLTEIENAIDIKLEEALTYMEPHYTIIQQASKSALLATAKNPKFVDQLINPLEDSGIQDYKPKMHNTLLVISNSESLQKQIENVKNSAEISIAQNPTFDSAKRNLPNTGQVFIFGKPENLWLIPENIKPDKETEIGFVIDKENGKTVYYSSRQN